MISRSRSCTALLIAALVVTGPVSIRAEGATSTRAYKRAEVQVTDLRGDAAYQGASHRQTPVQPSDAADIIEAWYTVDRSTITGHLRLSGNPLQLRDTPFDLNIQIRSNTILGREQGCLVFAASFPGVTTTGPGPIAVFGDVCREESKLHPAEFEVEDQEDGTTLLSITVARSVSPFFAPGRRLTRPEAMTRHTTEPFHQHVAYFDRTELGSTFRIPKG